MSGIRLTFWGAAGEVTGSMHLLEAAGGRFLLDAGLFQGRRAEAARKNAELPFDPRRIDAIILSHAHIDHAGRLPLLVRHGFHGPIYATPASRDLCAIMLPDSAHIQMKDAEYLARRGKTLGVESQPLYNLADAIAVQDLIVGQPYRRINHLRKHLAFEFTDAGHILGSASVNIRITEDGGHRLVFSGDIGRKNLPIIRDPDPPVGPVDTLIIESTYANRDHESTDQAEQHLGETIRRVAARGGKILIPAFAVGRTQEVVYSIHQLYRAGAIPHLPVFVDSPLAVDATTVFRMHPEVFDRREKLVERMESIFDFPLLQYVRDVKDSKRLNSLVGPAIIISASGMAEAGRILHHLGNHLGDHRNLVLFIGFQAEHTLGRRLQDGATEVKVFGETVVRRAEIETIGGYSAHADRNELRDWVKALGGPVRRAFVVHGEPEAAEAMRTLLLENGVGEVTIPRLGESFVL
ncbi:MAG: MBL fold metallo-hydrolase [Gemmatimonadales bacterium]|nr:MBL fold metallo-hydrolase [Gemmatimonadales bacterium]